MENLLVFDPLLCAIRLNGPSKQRTEYGENKQETPFRLVNVIRTQVLDSSSGHWHTQTVGLRELKAIFICLLSLSGLSIIDHTGKVMKKSNSGDEQAGISVSKQCMICGKSPEDYIPK